MSSQSTSTPGSGPPNRRSNLDSTFKVGFSTLNRPKQDGKGRIYREVRCLACRSWLADEYIFAGRLKMKCWRCGSVMEMDFKQKPNSKGGGGLEGSKSKNSS